MIQFLFGETHYSIVVVQTVASVEVSISIVSDDLEAGAPLTDPPPLLGHGQTQGLGVVGTSRGVFH